MNREQGMDQLRMEGCHNLSTNQLFNFSARQPVNPSTNPTYNFTRFLFTAFFPLESSL